MKYLKKKVYKNEQKNHGKDGVDKMKTKHILLFFQILALF